jgi:hypothetical protein
VANLTSLSYQTKLEQVSDRQKAEKGDTIISGWLTKLVKAIQVQAAFVSFLSKSPEPDSHKMHARNAPRS